MNARWHTDNERLTKSVGTITEVKKSSTFYKEMGMVFSQVSLTRQQIDGCSRYLIDRGRI